MQTKEVTITIERYHELLRKEFVYDFKREDVVADNAKGSYVTDSDRKLYQVPEDDF